ncbi:S1 family peptidase [Rariglobus hedericola]|uniref:Trypsin-like peptidase domain-containing protein n=1 Tax=Rariglobus hedericola TaxID=2597822 RepID=A0A556QMJ2_9BACT|nr:serine protease [Rariglobus hedericola]TSJ77866.1 trypsin-like peptidase domain-containing protein [Rariglobus hedericola]
MRILPFCCLLAFGFACSGLSAQTAQEIVDKAFLNYDQMPGYSAQLNSRRVTVMLAPQKQGEETRFDVRMVQYIRLELKWRKPEDWLVIKTTGVEATNNSGGSSSFSAVARNGAGAVQTSYYEQYGGNKVVTRTLAANQLSSQLNNILNGMVDSPVIKQLRVTSGDSGNIAWGLLELELKGEDAAQGRSAYRIMARNVSGAELMLWIDKENFALLRTLSVRRGGSSYGYRPPGSFGSPQDPNLAARVFTFEETLYLQQQFNPNLNAAAFAVPTTGRPESLLGEKSGFAGIGELVKWAPVSASTEVPGQTPAVAPAVNPAAVVAPAVVEQALTPRQMSGIVLIEGDESTASGFMTKIKGVDFVVTNLHVLGGNKKFTLRTLSGQELPVLGIFGAAGIDIAILRIGTGEGDLKLTEDVFKSSKIGNKVVVVGNRLGGGVATQTAGSIVGIGPTRIEVSANFESGNSGSPIVDLTTNEVVGVATYAETRRIRIEDGSAAGRTSNVEKRWFGYRIDGVTKWESIDLAKWNAQAGRIDKFRETSEALHAVIRFDFKTARQHPRLTSIVDGFENRYRAAGVNSLVAATEVKDLFRVIRTISDDGMRDLSSGDYYDYYRTCLYWENSISSQLDYRKAIIEVLKKYEANSSLYLSRMRSGNQ